MQPQLDPSFSYHLLRHALESCSKNLAQLSSDEYAQVQRKAQQSFALESQVLRTPEAMKVVVAESDLDRAVNQVAGRYPNHDDFIRDLAANQLDESALRQALHRELRFDAVMQSVAAAAATISDVDVRLYYELHPEKFTTPEQRTASHILITINSDYPENTPYAAQQRIEQVQQKLNGRVKRFGDFATQYSECPTAMQGGKLGEIVRGQLYPQLDNMLFKMQEQQISPIVESEMGFHLLYCEKITAGKRQTFSKVASQIKNFLQQRQQRNCQKAWLKNLSQE